jgi:hypothetical protein
MIDKDVPERVERLLQLAQHHGRTVTRIDRRLHPYGWRIAITAAAAVYLHWSDGKLGGRLACTSRNAIAGPTRRLSIATTEAIITGSVKP